MFANHTVGGAGIDVYSNAHVGISCPYYNIKVEQSKILNRNKCKKFVDFDKKWYYIYVHGRTLITSILKGLFFIIVYEYFCRTKI